MEWFYTTTGRTVISSLLRALILNTLHSAHQGVSCMTSRAESNVFWLGITPANANLRARWRSCNERVPSQPHGPPLAGQEPVYPFQCICTDYFKYKSCNYMVVVDRYFGWPIVQQSRDVSSGLVKCLREIFVTYGIADELSSDGEPEFTAEETQQLLSNWGVHHRLSSVALAHSNGRAELGVKTCKRMLMDNTGPNSEIRWTSTNFIESCFNTATPLTATQMLAPRRKPIEIRCCWSSSFNPRFLQGTTFSHWDPNLPWWALKTFERLSSILEIKCWAVLT